MIQPENLVSIALSAMNRSICSMNNSHCILISIHMHTHTHTEVESVNAANPFREVKVATPQLGKIEDELVVKIKASYDAKDLLDCLPTQSKMISPKATMCALRTLFNLQRTNE